MSQAMKLAERNEELEKELRDIDHIALAVEADCNSAVKENNKRVSQLQVNGIVKLSIASSFAFDDRRKRDLSAFDKSFAGKIRKCYDTSSRIGRRVTGRA